MTQSAIQKLSDLESWLASYQIDFGSWGRGDAKSVDDLLVEIKAGDSKLCNAMRVVEVAIILIKNGGAFLIESEQRLSDNRIRKRSWPPSEKLQMNETPLDAAKRCLFEELEISNEQQFQINPASKTKVEIKNSASYPGLSTEYHLHVFNATVEGLPKTPFVTQENSLSQDKVVTCHYWTWGELPADFAFAI